MNTVTFAPERQRRTAFLARCAAVLLAAVPWGFALYFAAQSLGGLR